MPIAKSRIVVALAILPMLGGCKVIFGQSLFGQLNRPSKPDIEQASLIPGDDATDEGREQLASGNPGAAIASFQRALANGETIAPAANGLGVAYARIGRPDLARRFFEQAIASAPGDPKYVANLERLITANQLQFAYREAVASAKVAAIPTRAEKAELQEPVGNKSVGTKLAVEAPMRRVSRSEVMITTTSPANASRLGRKVEPRPNFTPIVTLKIGRDQIADFRPIVRLQLPASKPVGDARIRAAVRAGDTTS